MRAAVNTSSIHLRASEELAVRRAEAVMARASLISSAVEDVSLHIS
jgi:hypothetical protein